ncbi:hypothetical protein [uncultured Sulfitobacter sp.]|uniref:hypothetical protein n=1 Tax=uncultured Sulfitobacter sp. TaxID=191468 RepID=UPI0026057A24|nr:hypothetical protein [uncultured Sulfitobacter sp.]
MRGNLGGHGDDGSAGREVSHFCYPDPSLTDVVSQKDVTEVFGEKGFLVRVLLSDDGGPDWLEMVHHSEVASAAFDMVTEWFLLRLGSLGWVYDGWSCAVIAGSGAEME